MNLVLQLKTYWNRKLDDAVMTLKDRLHICQEKGCWRRDTTECFLPNYDKPEAEWDVPDYYYCTQHAHRNGFCWSCGQFWAGIERFDFSTSELCENCEDEYREDNYDDECDYDPDPYDDMEMEPLQ